MIHILDARNWNRLVANIDNEDYYAGGYNQGLDGENILSFSISIYHPAVTHLTDMCRLVRRNRHGHWQEYVAWKITTSSMGRMTVLATGAEQEIDTLKIMHAGTYEAATLEEMADITLADTGYTLRRVDFASFQTETISNPLGGYAFLRRLSGNYERELRVQLEVSGTRILGRYVDLIERIGRDSRALVSFGDNLANLERIVHTDRIVTKLECRGPERSDGTRLTAVVVDDDAFKRWHLNGKHRVAYYEPDSSEVDMTQERLEQLGAMELKKRMNRVVEYIAGVAVLPDDDYALGDEILIEDTSFNPPLYAESRIIHESGPIEFNPDDVTELQYRLGELEEFSVADLRGEFKRLQELYAVKIIRQPEEPPAQKRAIWIEEKPVTGDTVFEVSHVANADLSGWVPMTARAAEEINGVELSKQYNKVAIEKERGLVITGVEEEEVGNIDGVTDNYTFPHISTGRLDAPNVMSYADYSVEPLTLRVASESTAGIGAPDDNNDGLGWSSPIRTISEALKRVAPMFRGEARILVAFGQTFNEEIEIRGFGGGGTLIIERSADTTRPVVAGNVIIENNVNRIEWRDINLDSTDSYAGFFVRQSSGLIYSAHINGAAGETTSSININAGASFEIIDVRHSNCVTAVRSSYGGVAYVTDNTGQVTGPAFVGFGGGVVSGGGTAPTGSALKSEIFGGSVPGTWTVPTPPAPPAPKAKTIKGTWSATSDSGTWRADENRYDIYGASVNNVTQGAYRGYGPFTGAWFFGNSPSASVNGKTIKSIRLYIGRVSGGSGSGVSVRFRPHTSTSRPGGRVTLQTPEHIASFRVGEDKWITLPSSFHSGFASGTIKGIAIYSGSAAYAKMKKTARLEITYEG